MFDYFNSVIFLLRRLYWYVSSLSDCFRFGLVPVVPVATSGCFSVGISCVSK